MKKVPAYHQRKTPVKILSRSFVINLGFLSHSRIKSLFMIIYFPQNGGVTSFFDSNNQQIIPVKKINKKVSQILAYLIRGSDTPQRYTNAT
jgi:hypothetical protein